jgi:hypothetical protein
VGGDGLIEMPFRGHHTELVQQRMDLVVRARQIQHLGERMAQLTVFDGETVAFEAVEKSRKHLLEAGEIELMRVPIGAACNGAFDKIGNNRVRETASVLVQPVRGIQEMPGNCARAISQTAYDAGVLQAVFEEKTINGAMAKVGYQIGGGENCASRELRHIQICATAS